MKAIQRKVGQAKSEILSEIPKACMYEKSAVEFMEKQRWGDTPACPRCGDIDVKQVKDSNGGRNKRYLWRCHGCKKQFTVRIGTIMEDSRIPLRIWCYAFWKACSSKKGISALQISRECNLAYKSALFLMHRIRYAMTGPKNSPKLSGIVEVDETYVGGKPRIRGKNKRGKGTKKVPVMVMVERNGDARTRVVPDVTGNTLKQAIRDNVYKWSTIMTDDNRSYFGLAREYIGGHETTNHSRKEYVRGNVHSNTAESFFAILKRGVYGTFHSVSKKHLHRYVNEFEFRWNTRKIDDGQRLSCAIKGADGKRLMYKEPILKNAI